jgi:hypothetical protein
MCGTAGAISLDGGTIPRLSAGLGAMTKSGRTISWPLGEALANLIAPDGGGLTTARPLFQSPAAVQS